MWTSFHARRPTGHAVVRSTARRRWKTFAGDHSGVAEADRLPRRTSSGCVSGGKVAWSGGWRAPGLARPTVVDRTFAPVAQWIEQGFLNGVRKFDSCDAQGIQRGKPLMFHSLAEIPGKDRAGTHLARSDSSQESEDEEVHALKLTARPVIGLMETHERGHPARTHLRRRVAACSDDPGGDRLARDDRRGARSHDGRPGRRWGVMQWPGG